MLMCVGLPLKYLDDNDTVVTWTAIPHGWLYMLLLITALTSVGGHGGHGSG